MHDAHDALQVDQKAEAWGQLRRSVVTLCRLGVGFRDLVVAMELSLRNEEERMLRRRQRRGAGYEQ